jgi:hypothetical protein
MAVGMAIALRSPTTMDHRFGQPNTQQLSQPPGTVTTTERQHDSTQATACGEAEPTGSIGNRPAELASPYWPSPPSLFARTRYPDV